jgi:hypothetical protein
VPAVLTVLVSVAGEKIIQPNVSISSRYEA